MLSPLTGCISNKQQAVPGQGSKVLGKGKAKGKVDFPRPIPADGSKFLRSLERRRGTATSPARASSKKSKEVAGRPADGTSKVAK